jgi:histone H1/5
MSDLTSGPTSLNTSQTTSSGSNANKKSKSSAANKSKKAKGTSSHPKYSAMIKQAITQLNDRNGTSKAAILKYILANFKVNSASANQHLKSALRAGTKNKTLKQTKGVGASGSFKLAASPSKKGSSAGTKKKSTTKKSTTKTSSATKSRSRSKTPGGSKKTGGTKTKKASSSSKPKSSSGTNKRKRSASPTKKTSKESCYY